MCLHQYSGETELRHSEREKKERQGEAVKLTTSTDCARQSSGNATIHNYQLSGNNSLGTQSTACTKTTDTLCCRL